ncbi:LAQU0S19e00980g1_1 [Lachancea quebecensis]|uniref:triacylglycerol lipase n=1 Tax=Lachancea quebecensis TaxID=1654605 RepID=A0A0P1KXD2_9SACH|nr:LAQU0S19e00980g1_1 [Lachancea quebecensis]
MNIYPSAIAIFVFVFFRANTLVGGNVASYEGTEHNTIFIEASPIMASGNNSNVPNQWKMNDTVLISPHEARNFEGVAVTKELYERLVYFSKMCALTYCITSNELNTGLSFKDGGCPSKLDFCSSKDHNPTLERTIVELVILAESGELGTGYLAVDHEKKVVVLSFRGSTTNQDWLSDFAVYPVTYMPCSKDYYEEWVKSGRIRECTGCFIHRGFNVFLNTLSSQFFDRIEGIFQAFPNYNLVVTGHSLGAAVASLAGIELKLRGYEPLLLTYASPNFFNGALRAWVDELFETKRIHDLSLEEGKVMFRKGYFRVVHNQDYITMVPPFYEPAGLEIFINNPCLPHKHEDLEYRGPSQDLISLEATGDTSVISTGRGQGHWYLGPLERLLHMYEHRSYFILINTCEGF